VNVVVTNSESYYYTCDRECGILFSICWRRAR